MKKNPFHSYHLDTSYLTENHLSGEDLRHLRHSLIEYPLIFLKWLLAAVLIGLAAGRGRCAVSVFCHVGHISP